MNTPAVQLRHVPHSPRCTPRIHDLRHTFAVTTLLGWYRDGAGTFAVLVASSSDLDDLIPTLVAYQVEWNKLHTLLRASDRLVEHLCAHGYSDGFAFLEHGHVTNNTSNANADYRKEAGAFQEMTSPARARHSLPRR